MSTLVRDAGNKVLDNVRLKALASPHEDGQAFLLPDGYRDFVGQGNRKLPPGKYTAEVFSVFGSKSIRIAKSGSCQRRCITGSFERAATSAPLAMRRGASSSKWLPPERGSTRRSRVVSEV